MISASGVLTLAILATGASAGAVQFDGIPTVGILHPGTDINAHNCTASVVESKVGNVIVTAAHCISGTGKGLHFVPGFDKGKAPYGSYPVLTAHIHPEWNKRLNINYDYAFLTLGMGKHNGKSTHVQAVVGANKLVTTGGYNNVVEVVSYPNHQSSPVHCSGVHTFEQQANQMGFNCGPLPGGTSGSPWIANYNPKTKRGNVIGNIGGLHEGGCSVNTSFSSKYGSGTLSAYNSANNGRPGNNVRKHGGDGC